MTCANCAVIETSNHAFLLCNRLEEIWINVTNWLKRLVYNNFRIEHTEVLYGDEEKDKLFNLIIVLGKQMIYLNIEKGNAYSMVHRERMIRRESKVIYVMYDDEIELYPYNGKGIYSTEFQFLHQSTGCLPVPGCTNTRV